MSTAKVAAALAELSNEIDALKARCVVTDEMAEHLREIHRIAYIEGYYDPVNEKSRESAQLIYPHIKALNAVLRFKR